MPTTTAPAAARARPKPADQPASPLLPPGPPASPAPSSAAPLLSTSASRTHIGQTVRVQGELTGSEDLIIDGFVEGRVVLHDHCLTIGEHGNVSAELWARNIKIVGTVVGNVHADDRIEVAKGGSVEGDLQAPKVVLAEGARLKGRVDMLGNVTAPPPSGSLQSAGFAPAAARESDFGSEVDESQAEQWAQTADATFAEAAAATAKNDARDEARAEKKDATKTDAKAPGQETAKDRPAEERTGKANSKLASVLSDFDPANP
ncbi:MAG TPA: polymer-forming cytoskeletal protein [Planctomycetota bacterium]|nr:polymer-forming cytoskeletal protein [Planctomycetota bacterium]